MSMRDPILRLADLVIENYDDWALIAETMEPRHGDSIATLLIARGSSPGSPVERFVIRREDLLEVLRVVGEALRTARKNKTMRAILRLRYGERPMTYGEVATVLHFSESTVRRCVDSLRRRVAGALLNLGARRLSALWPFIDRSLNAFRLPD